MKRWLLRQRGATVDGGVRIAGGTRIVGPGALLIGADSWIGPYGIFYTNPDAPISIGARCDVGPGVHFVTGTHLIGTSERRAGLGKALPIVVGNGCWLGARATVLAGVTVGDGAIVAAGAVVASNVAPNTLVGGVPARLIRTLEP
jgi:maltose O-acetyltransferase